MATGGANIVVRNVGATVVIDNDASVIGDLYQKARGSLVDSLRYSIECGCQLNAKKETTPHGQWLPWLEANADVLGFSNDSTARRLMTLARENSNRALTHDLSEAEAAALSRQTWGNNKKSISRSQPDPDEVANDVIDDDAPLRLPGKHERQRLYDGAPKEVRSAVDAFLSLRRKDRDAAWQLINLYDQLGGQPASSEKFIITRVED